jgi:hypothetical protein
MTARYASPTHPNTNQSTNQELTQFHVLSLVVENWRFLPPNVP